MDKVWKDKWITALRSGKYRQGKHGLLFQTKDGQCEYCCLGVLVDLVSQEHPSVCQWKKDEGQGIYVSALTSDEQREETSAIPLEILELVGLDDANPTPPVGIDGLPVESDDEIEASLAELNDSGQFSFADIANIIETYL